MKKSIHIGLIAILFIQSCVVYQKTSVPIDQAIDNGEAKVQNIKGKEAKYKNIRLENNAYYGNKGQKEVLLDTLLVSNVYLKDIKKSKQQTIVNIGSVGLGIAIYVIFLVLISP